MNSKVILYFSCVVAAALALFERLEPGELLLLDRPEVLGLIGFVFIGLLAEALAIDFGQGPKAAKSSLAFVPFLACAVLFPPVAAMAAVFVVAGISNFLIWRRRVAPGLFNIAQGVIAAGLGAMVYGVLEFRFVQGAQYIAFAVTAVAFFATNMVLSSVALALMRNESPTRVFFQVIGPGGANLWYDLLASPIAFIAAILYDGYHVTGIIAIILPLLLIRYSYESKVQLQAANSDLLHVLVKAIETRDPYTSGHSRRVSALAGRIARDLGFPQRKIETVEQAALLHDIGKIDPRFSEIIQKPYSLTTEERELIRVHATAGADLLRSLSTVGPEVIEAVRHHHERYDGDGYPDGLTGESIPIIARIIMLCDSIDAMLSDRPYRNALTIEHVEEELRRCSGTQFDPQIASVMLTQRTLHNAKEIFIRTTTDERVLM